MIHLSMITVAFFCFVGAFLFDPTLGLIQFSSDDPARTTEYIVSDGRTLFHLISDDLTRNRRVVLAVPPSVFAPSLDASLAFSVDLQGQYLNGYNDRTGRPNRYSFNGHFFALNVVQGEIRVLRSEAREQYHAGGWSLFLNMTFEIEEMHIHSRMGYEGTWRDRAWSTENGLFYGHWRNVEINYQTTFPLLRDGDNWILELPMVAPVITANTALIMAVDISMGNIGAMYNWRAIDRGDNEQTDLLLESLTPVLLTRIAGSIDRLVRRAIGIRLYRAPQRTPITAPANMSGYSCRRPPARERRETKLYN